MQKPTVLVVGSLNTDLITRTARIPAAGETLVSQSFDTGCGGKGANQAVACARLSRKKHDNADPAHANVRMVGAVGDDLFGQDLVKGLQANGVNTDGINVMKGEKSGVACIIVEESTGENRILVSPNANFSLKPGGDLISSIFSPTPPDLIVLQLEIPLDTTLKILESAYDRKISVVLNPAPAQILPKEAYRGVHHLIVNETEAAIITGTSQQNPSWLEWGNHVDKIIHLGVVNIIITLGAEGVVYLNTFRGKMWTWPAKEVQVVDTTAAGDTFVGAYVVALMRINPLPRYTAEQMTAVISWANEAASKAVEKQGAQTAIPWLDEVRDLEYSKLQKGITFDAWKQKNEHGTLP